MDKHDPKDYAGEPVCIRCGSGWPCCADRDALGNHYSHADTCDKYNWSGEVCDQCEVEMAAEDAREDTYASDPTQVGTTVRLDVKTAQTGAQHSNERNK